MSKTHRVVTTIVCEEGRHVNSRILSQVLSEVVWRCRGKLDVLPSATSATCIALRSNHGSSERCTRRGAYACGMDVTTWSSAPNSPRSMKPLMCTEAFLL